jgi:hypothetical protein
MTDAEIHEIHVNLKIQKTAIIHEKRAWYAEIVFADLPDLEQAAATIAIRVPLNPQDESPHFVMLLREGLRHAQTAIHAEMERLALGRGPSA